jgi:hypothetical protein
MKRMESRQEADGSITVRMSEAEAVVLHLKIADSEFENALEEIGLALAVDQKVFSDVQQALAPLIPGLGTTSYQQAIDEAYAAIDPSPYAERQLPERP